MGTGSAEAKQPEQIGHDPEVVVIPGVLPEASRSTTTLKPTARTNGIAETKQLIK